MMATAMLLGVFGTALLFITPLMFGLDRKVFGGAAALLLLLSIICAVL